MTKAGPVRGKGSRAPSAPAGKRRVKLGAVLRRAAGEGPLNRHWRNYFLAALVETSNVSASAERAGVSASRAYRLRREDPGFAAQWRTALCEGYENLEMDLLGFLRDPRADHKMDVANGIRLLAQHRQFVAQQRALTDDRSEAEVLDSIDAMIDAMRERAAANAALLAAPDEEEPADGAQ